MNDYKNVTGVGKTNIYITAEAVEKLSLLVVGALVGASITTILVIHFLL